MKKSEDTRDTDHPRQAALSRRELAVLQRLADVLIPRGGPFPLGAADVDTADRLARYIGRFPRRTRTLLRLLLLWWEVSPLLSRYRQPFSRLDATDREAYLHETYASRRPWLRLPLFWLRTLCLTAFTSDPRVEEALGFTHSCVDESPPRVGPRLEPIAYPQVWGPLEERADVCVIGSGAGGAVIAKELAEGGLSVIVIEEGAYFTQEDFQGPLFERVQKLYRDGGLTAALGRRTIPIPLGKCVGGTTVVNSGTCFRAPDSVLREWESRWGIEGADPASMEPIFRRVEEIIGVKPTPRELMSENALLFQRGVEALGYHGAPIPRNIDGCRGCGVCALGCPSDAKQAMHLSYLPRAARHGARVYARCRARRIVVEKGRAVAVEADILDARTDQFRGRLRVRSPVVVLAAGAIHSPAFLMANGLGRSSGQVGKNLTIHPSLGIAALFEQEVYGWRGTLQPYYVDELQESLGVMLEVTSPLPGVGASLLPGIGLEAKEMLARYKHTALVGVFVADSSRGRVLRGPGPGAEPTILYDLNREDRRRLVQGIALAGEIFLEAGASAVYTGLSRLPVVQSREELEQLREVDAGAGLATPTGFHPMGTCRMGSDPATSVVGPYGEVHGVKNLFVADASVFPSCVGVNPQVTIMAFATRTARHILENSDRYLP